MDVSKYWAEYANERTWAIMIFSGLAIFALAYIWLALRAVAASKWWRIGYLPPLAILYLLSFSRRVVAPLVFMLIGIGLVATPFVITHWIQPKWTDPWEKEVDGQIHLTLTGVPNFEYAKLKAYRPFVVLQMANPDVTDETLDLIANQTQLERLDISGSQVSDAGLVKLKSLPKLRTLWIKNTKVTDEGFRESLFESPTLMELDATGTEIKGATLRKWKAAKADRKALN